MKKTFLEWSVADKKAQREKLIKEMLRTPIKWVPNFPEVMRLLQESKEVFYGEVKIY